MSGAKWKANKSTSIYYGHKLHLDQNEKLAMYGVNHVCAIDGFSKYIPAFSCMPVKNVVIYNDIFRLVYILCWVNISIEIVDWEWDSIIKCRQVVDYQIIVKENHYWRMAIWSSQSGSWQRILLNFVCSRKNGPPSNKSHSRSTSSNWIEKGNINCSLLSIWPTGLKANFIVFTNSENIRVMEPAMWRLAQPLHVYM